MFQTFFFFFPIILVLEIQSLDVFHLTGTESTTGTSGFPQAKFVFYVAFSTLSEKNNQLLCVFSLFP